MKKNKGKKIFAHIVVFAIFTAILLSIYLCDSSRIGEGNVFKLVVDEEQEMFETKDVKRIDGDMYLYNGPLITEELAEEILHMSGVKKASLGTKVSVLMESIQFPGKGVGKYDYEMRKMEASKRYGVYYGSGHMLGSDDKYNVLRGYNDTSLADYFRTGALKLVEGDHITDEDGYKVLISDELAELNSLSVGDAFATKMQLYDSLQGKLGAVIMEIELEVAGIFHVNTEQDLEGYPLKEDIAVNFMFVNNKTVREYDQMYRQIFLLDEEPFVYTSAEFFVGNPLRLESVMNKVEDKADDTYFSAKSTAEIDKDLAKAYRRINRTSFVLTGWFGLSGFILLILLFRKKLFTKKDFVTLVISMVLATGIAFVGTGFSGDLMMKFIGVEEVITEERDPMTLPITVQEQKAYYEYYEVKCNVIEAGPFKRDVSVVMMAAGEIAIVMMCGLAFVLGKRKKI